jgi:hypothetical protein
MDLVLAGQTEDELQSSLEYKLSPTANYITSRRSVRNYPSGASSLSTRGLRVARVNIGSDGSSFIDPSTVQVTFTIQNNSTTGAVAPVSGPACFFSRCRVFCGGQLTEDIQYFNRVSHMFREVLMSPDWRLNEGIKGYSTRDLAHIQGRDVMTNVIAPGESLTVAFRPLAGILSTGKLLPSRFANLQFEFTLADSAESCWATSADHGGFLAPRDFDRDNFVLDNFYIACDVVQLDSALENSFYQVLASRKSLTMGFPTFATQFSTLTASQNVSVNCARALSRLKSAFITFQTDAAYYNQKVIHYPHPGGSGVDLRGAGNHALKDVPFKYQIAIGSRLFPETPADSVQEQYSVGKKALNLHDISSRQVDIDLLSYLETLHILGMSFEKAPGSAFASGYNLRSGDLLRVSLENMSPGRANGMYLTLVHDVVLEIKEHGCSVYD